MNLIITPLTGIAAGIFLFLGHAGLKKNLGLYTSIKPYDKIIHFVAGVVFAMFLLDNNASIFWIIFANFLSGVFWEIFQIKAKERVGFKKVGFPDGWGDIFIHMVGTFAYLAYVVAI